MKLKTLFFISSVALLAMSMTWADEVIIKENPEPPQKVSLNPYSLGFGIGNIVALNKHWQNKDEQLLKLSIIQSIEVNDKAIVNMDINWFIPGSGWGGDLSADYLLAGGSFRPFLGAGVGLQYVDKKNGLGNGFGAAGTVHAGLLIDLMDELQVRVRVPYHFIANKDRDMGVGLDIGFLFSTSQRKMKVEKLHP